MFYSCKKRHEYGKSRRFLGVKRNSTAFKEITDHSVLKRHDDCNDKSNDDEGDEHSGPVSSAPLEKA